MKTSPDCIPCFLRQARDAAGLVSPDRTVQERIAREVLCWSEEMDLDQPPIVFGQRLHRHLREIAVIEDPYRAAKDRFNQLAIRLLPDLRAIVTAANDPLEVAARIAIAGNVIDMGVPTGVTEQDVHRSLSEALAAPPFPMLNEFRQAVASARSILYLADNAGEIVFDRLLIEQLSPAGVILAVRGSPVINDATVADARAAGLHELVEVVGNGSDAPGTILGDCSPEFIRRFEAADLILAKGQGNFETLSDEPRNIFFLFKAKCPVIAAYAGQTLGSYVLARSPSERASSIVSGR
ncbi:MAG: damage-control phosphatase ARMT1 family protein [Bryobacteraceae bacterium]